MAGERDEFGKRTRQDLALRASYRCSICDVSTAGPSDEAPDAVTMIGVAAHICAAASGPGARRYDPSMTPAQRKHIDNGIWLCQSCGKMIDDDEARFTVEELRRLKREHEASRRMGGPADRDGDIIAIGRGIVAVGTVLRTGPEGIRVAILHFVSGSARDLLSSSQDFGKWPPSDRYALFNELGFGGVLASAPVVERKGRGFEVELQLEDAVPRRSAAAPISTMSAATLRMIQGLDAYVQVFERVLGMAAGTWFADLDRGSDLSDLYWRYRGSPWFKRLAMMEMIRLSCIPKWKNGHRSDFTPFMVVNRVDGVDVPDFELSSQRLRIEVTFDLEGIGPWTHNLSVFISTPDQLAEGRRDASRRVACIREIEAANGGAGNTKRA